MILFRQSRLTAPKLVLQNCRVTADTDFPVTLWLEEGED